MLSHGPKAKIPSNLLTNQGFGPRLGMMAELATLTRIQDHPGLWFVFRDDRLVVATTEAIEELTGEVPEALIRKRLVSDGGTEPPL